ncbi:MAG: SDR family NAD(P)-dependent oxidoreductase [Candidatus Ranarchaeia archaeon]|jgi:NAD(P)-dependent dehydrogenase (short-subunit alcohol dehydrogenase family)
MKKLLEKVILVTGSGRGFGRAMAYAFALEGAKIVSVSRTVSELKSLENKIREKRGDVLTIPVDLRVEREILGLRDKVIEYYGKLDVLVNNAATSPWKLFEDMTIKEWDATISVNLRAPFILSKVFLDSMKKQGHGSIINVTSKSSEIGFLAETGYCPSKFGIEGLTQCLAMELHQYNIAVNSLGVNAPPGLRLKPTELTIAEADEMPEEIRKMYANDESIAEAFGEAWTFLALQDAKGVTGQRLGSRQLAESLKNIGWEETCAKWKRKLTKAVYVSYDFPKTAKYQTPTGGFKEIKFKF